MTEPAASSHPGMGAHPYPDGTAFRLWAPHADRVGVVGSFNHWNPEATPLASEGSGYWSADVEGAAAGDEYKFVIHNGARTLWRNDPYAREMTHSAGNSVIYDRSFDWEGCSFDNPPWNELVLYEMHIGTFNDQPGGPPGNLDRAIERLGHLSKLGVNAIELMPAAEFAGGFSWGYNPAYLFAIEADYGGPRAFKQFIKVAHRLGIAVIFDVVYNHFGPSDLDLWQFDGWQQSGKGGIYFYNDWRSPTPWGDTRPDYGRSEVRRFIRDNALMWLQEYRMDGLRWDATAYIRNVYGKNNDRPHDLADGYRMMQRINDDIDQRQPWKLAIAEDLRDNPWLTKDTASGGAGFDSQWDGRFVHPVREALITRNDRDRNMGAVADAIAHSFNGNPWQRVIYTESHDEVANGKARVPEEVWPGNAGSWASKKRATLGAALVLTSPGIPMLFQGQEMLEDEWFRDQDPLDWSKLETYRGIVLLHRDLIRLRRNWYDHTRGLRGPHVHVHHVNHTDKLIAFHRWDQGGARDSVVVVVNMSNRGWSGYRIGLPRGGRWRVRLNSDWRGYDKDFGNWMSLDTDALSRPRDDMPYSGSIGIGPYSVVILSQDA